MARMSYNIPEELEEQLRKAGEIHEIAMKMVEAGAEVYIKAIKNRLEPHRDTGALIDSTSIISKRATGSGAEAIIGFDGYDGKGVANDLKANALELKPKLKGGDPFITKSRNDAYEEAMSEMQNVFDYEIGAT